MSVKLKPLAQQVIVITGASSGIGLATARMAAKRGAKLVLAARNEQALQQLAAELQAAGGQAVAVAADVGDESAVRRIAHAAVETFGGFDTWVNDAGVGIYGKLLEVSHEDSRRLFETNFWGVVYGSLEAARHLKSRGGAIIKLGSEVSDRAIPVLGMYATSKHAVKGFTDALRMELEMDHAPVSVSLVKPSAIDTPFPQHAQNYLDEEPTLPAPVYHPHVAAEAILHCAEHPERDIFAGGKAAVTSWQGALLPRVTDWLLEAIILGQVKSKQPPNHDDDALHVPTTGLHERGNFAGHVQGTSLYTKASMHPALAGVALLGLGAAALALTGAGRGRRG